MNKKHPYELRKHLRSMLPWFIIDMGFASKGKDCAKVNADHSFYNIDGKTNGCYYCEQVFERDPSLTKNSYEQNVIEQIANYLKGEKTSREIYDKLNTEEGDQREYSHQFMSDLSASIGIDVFDSGEFDEFFPGATRLGIINLIENYQQGNINELEIENWSDANECWTIVKNENSDDLVQQLINEFGFGEMHAKELFTDKVLNQLIVMLKRRESSEIEEFKLTTLFERHKRRLANALSELKGEGDSGQLKLYLEERSKLTMNSQFVEELIRQSFSERERNMELIDKFINDYINGRWEAGS